MISPVFLAVQISCAGKAIRFGKRCYEVKNTPKGTVKESADSCRNQGGELVSISDTTQQNFVARFVKGSDSAKEDHWIGK